MNWQRLVWGSTLTKADGDGLMAPIEALGVKAHELTEELANRKLGAIFIG